MAAPIRASNILPAGNASRLGGLLCLAATPTFAIMAGVTAMTGGSGMICSSTPGLLPFDGMAIMYLLMSTFHLPAWLKLLSGRRDFT